MSRPISRQQRERAKADYDLLNPKSGMTRAELTQAIRLLVDHDTLQRATIKIEDTHAEGPLRGHGGGVHVTFAAVPPGTKEIDAMNAPNFMLSIDAPAWHQVATSTRGTPDEIVHKVTLRQFRGRIAIKGRTSAPLAMARYVADLLDQHARAVAISAPGRAAGKAAGRIAGRHLALDEIGFARIDKRAAEIRQEIKRLRERDKSGRASGHATKPASDPSRYHSDVQYHLERLGMHRDDAIVFTNRRGVALLIEDLRTRGENAQSAAKILADVYYPKPKKRW